MNEERPSSWPAPAAKCSAVASLRDRTSTSDASFLMFERKQSQGTKKGNNEKKNWGCIFFVVVCLNYAYKKNGHLKKRALIKQ